MVNTFCLDVDFAKSAALLNSQRLGKQRVEANQILNAIRHLRYVAKVFNLPDFPTGVDTPREQRDAWSKRVFDTFKKSVAGILIRDGQPQLLPLGQALPEKLKTDRVLYRSREHPEIIYECKQLGPRSKTPLDAYSCPTDGSKPIPLKIEKRGHWTQFVWPNEELITLGFSRHTAVTMWIGFETALMDYINVHIDEWVKRGYVNNMKKYDVPPTYPRPAWSFDPKIIDNFQCSLVERELGRKEEFWYSYQPEMVKKFTKDQKNFEAFWDLISRHRNCQQPFNQLLSWLVDQQVDKQIGQQVDKQVIQNNQENEPLDPQVVSNLHQILHRHGSFAGFEWP